MARIKETFIERYEATFKTRFHNHMRIRRILCHMNNCGFRRYAIQLVKFLEFEIYGDLSFEKFTKDSRLLAVKIQDIESTSPLKMLARLKVYEEWMIYGDIDYNNEESVQILQDNCLA